MTPRRPYPAIPPSRQPSGRSSRARKRTLISIENLLGSALDDVLTGDGSANTLDGGAIDIAVLSGGTFAVGDVANAAPVAADDGVLGLVEAGRDGDGVTHATGNVLLNDTHANLAVVGLGETLTVVGVQPGGVTGAFTPVPDMIVVQCLYGTLTIMVIGADDTIAGNDSLQVVKGRASSLDVSVLLGNDAGATGETLTVTGVFNAVGAAVSLVAGKLVIIASQATGGFDYTVTTSGGGTASGHVDLSALTPTVRLTATAPAGVTAVDYVGANAADKLTGGDGADRLVGAGGADKLDGGAGADRMEGGAGADTYRVDNAGDQVVEADDPGADTVVTALASYTLGDFKENLTFDGTGSFIGTGNASRNTLISRAGSDSLFGGDGVDTLIGGAGDDLLDGGTSLDTVSYVTASVGVTVDLRLAGQQDTVGAGRGADTFVFQALSDIADGDLIADFSQAQGDIIDLSAIDADATVAGQQTFTFIGTTTFSGAAGAGCEIRFEAGSGRNLVVQGDVDHDGLADFQFLVTTPTLAASDFDLNP